MNKKVLSAILFSALFAGTGTFTSCIDNDEPAGIEELRGAKAELIRAKVAVEEAEAARLMAVAEYEKARASHEQANATYRLAEAKVKEAEAELKEVETEAKRAELEQKIAEYELEMAEAIKESELALAKLETQIVKAQRQHEVTLKQIAIAKALGDDKVNVTLEALEGEVNGIYETLYGTDGKSGLVAAIRVAKEKVYDAQLNKEAGDAGFDWIPSLKLAVEAQQAAVAANEEAVAKLETFLEKDVETTDWRAEVEALSDSVEALKLAIDEKELEKTQALNSEEWLAADQKLNGVKKDGAVVKNGTVQTLAAKKAEYNKYAVGGSKAIKLALSKVEVKPVAELAGVIDDAIAAYETEKEVDVTAWTGTKFELAKTTYYQPVYGTKLTAANGYVPAQWLNQVNYFAGALAMAELDENAIVGAQNKLEAAQEKVAEMDSLYNEVAYVQWEVAKKAVNENVATPIAEGDVKKVTDAITAYNTGAAAFNAAITAYNDAYKAIYDGAKTEYVEQEYYSLYAAVIRNFAENVLRDYPFNVNNHSNKIAGVWAYAEDNGWKSISEELEAMFVADPTIKDLDPEDDVNEATIAAEQAAEILADAKREAKRQADRNKANNYDWEEASTREAEKAILADEDEVLADALEAIEEKAEALNDATNKGLIASLKDAYDAYATLAKTYYAQVPTADAAKVALPGVPTDKDGNVEWYTVPEKADANGHVLFTSKVAEMTAENATKKIAMELTKDNTVLQAALNAASQAAFGMDERYIEPTEEEVREAAAGAWYNWLLAQDALESLENYLASSDKLAEVAEAVAAAKKALETEIAANEAQFADLDAAVVAANTANEVAKKELAAITNTLVGSLNVEIGKLQAKKNATNSVMTKLQTTIAAHLHLDGFTSYADAEAFEKALASALTTAKTTLASSEQLLAQAEKNLKKAEEGLYDDLADAEYELSLLMEQYDYWMAELEAANARLEKALEIMLAE